MITGLTGTLPLTIIGVLVVALLVAYGVAWYRIITKAGFSGRWFLLPIGALVISFIASSVAASSSRSSVSYLHFVTRNGTIYTVAQPSRLGISFYIGSVVATLMVLSIIAMFFTFAFMPWPIHRLNRYPSAVPEGFGTVLPAGGPFAPPAAGTSAGPPPRSGPGLPPRAPLAADRPPGAAPGLPPRAPLAADRPPGAAPGHSAPGLPPRAPLGSDGQPPPATPLAPTPQPAPIPPDAEVVYCSWCGAPRDARSNALHVCGPTDGAPSFCMRCGTPLSPGAAVCGSCGTPTSEVSRR
jgi:hypothetical protein